MLIKKEISDKVLVISPDYKNAKGGIAMVVNTLSNYYEIFHFIASTKSKNRLVVFWCFLQCITKLLYFIAIKKVKIVHIHSASYRSFFRKMMILNICKFLHVKIVFHIHGGEFHLFHKKQNKFNIIDRTLRKADILIVLSKKWELFFANIADSEKITVLNNIINKPQKVNQVKKYNDKIHFLFLGVIGEKKGVFDLLHVIIENKDKLDGKAVFYIGGNGKADQLVRLIEENQLQDIVKFEGWVSGKEKIELLNMCDVYVLPSYHEGLPISILEAMSYEMPIISTNVGGIPEIVTPNKNGFLMEAGNKQKLFEFIQLFIQFPEKIHQMGGESLKIVENFYPDAVIPQLNGLYKKLLN